MARAYPRGVRTTLNLPDALLLRLKAHAQQNGTTVTSVVEQALVDALDRAAAHSDAQPIFADFPVLGVPGSTPLVDLSDVGALHDVLDGVRPHVGEAGADGGGSDRSTTEQPVPAPPEGSIARLVESIRADRAAEPVRTGDEGPSRAVDGR